MKILLICVVSVQLILYIPQAFAFETDQYNLPPTPLIDIGDEVSDHVADVVREAMERINADIAKRESCLANPTRRTAGCGAVNSERRKLSYLRSGDALALEVFRRLGDGFFPLSHVGHWLNSHKFRGEPSRYKTSFQDSIYAILPTNYLTISPTVRLYGSEFGVDKIEHFFQQGYAYYKIYQKAVASGSTLDQAARKAVKWGQMTERTYYGFLVSGVFSNADLYSNYAGMKFYLGLTRTIRIGPSERPSTVVFKDGRWSVNGYLDLREHLLRPFISDHLNEALNPSGYVPVLFQSVRNAVRKRGCPQWLKRYPRSTRSELDAISGSLRSWHNEDYGFTEKRRMLMIGDLCFPM
jgi:hypothetical protein